MIETKATVTASDDGADDEDLAARGRDHARAQLSVRLGALGINVEFELNRYLTSFRRSVREAHLRFLGLLLEGYRRAVATGACPMRSQAAWARALGMSAHAFRRHWEAVRSWRVRGYYVFPEGSAALRSLTYWEPDAPVGPPGAAAPANDDDAPRKVRSRRVRRVLITAGGVALRRSDMVPLPTRWTRVVFESTVESTRVLNQTNGEAAYALERANDVTAEQKHAVRRGRIGTYHAAGQLPLPFTRAANDDGRGRR